MASRECGFDEKHLFFFRKKIDAVPQGGILD